ncbi:unnamed protein product [Schistosoma curassoni]|uniref:Ovule protein n=1 Tax=Schistosoma curassoni TaxID=6186 RepID=A0A183K7G9_9TREM|nr:unnamed protein product [Schistosoma curassoni]
MTSELKICLLQCNYKLCSNHFQILNNHLTPPIPFLGPPMVSRLGRGDGLKSATASRRKNLPKYVVQNKQASS